MSAEFGPPPKFDRLLGKSSKLSSDDQNSPTLGLEPGKLKQAMSDRAAPRQRKSLDALDQEIKEVAAAPPASLEAPAPTRVPQRPASLPDPTPVARPPAPSAENTQEVRQLQGQMAELKLELDKLRYLLQQSQNEAGNDDFKAQMVARLEALEKALASKLADKKMESRLDDIERRMGALSNQAAVGGGVAAVPAAPAEDSGGLSEFDISLEKPADLEFELDDLLRVVIKHRASDLHIKPHAPPTVRLHGELIPIGRDRLTPAQAGFLVASGLPGYKRERILQRLEVDHAYVVEDVRFRVNAFLERGHLSGAYRMVDAVIPTFQELGLPPVLEELASLKDGLVLVTGPAGSGKSTTLASVIDWINKNRKTHVVTIEDPIEYQHRDQEAFITQREVGSDTTSFTEALRQALRQDPNVIMLGEMRDAETILTAVTAAETGHLVLSTLHTPNAVQAVDRIVDTFSGSSQKQIRLLLSSCLRGVVSQKLLNRRSGAGRVPAVEVMLCTSTIASHILDGQTGEIYQYIQRGGNMGMQTFTQSLARLVEEGAITREEALTHADQPTELRLLTEGKTSSTLGKDSEGYASYI